MKLTEIKNGNDNEFGLEVINTSKVKKEDSYFRIIFKRFLKHRIAVLGSIILILLSLTAIFAPLIAPYDPYKISNSFASAPTIQHLLGTDLVGRDNLSRLIYASRVSLLVGIGSVIISVLIGVVIGLISGYFGGWIDMLLMRITDMFLAFPQIMLVLVVVSVVGPSLLNIIIVLGILGWPAVARLVRGGVLSIKEVDFVNAAVVLGLKTPRILIHHIFPNIFSPILVHATFSIAVAIIIEASLSFLGMGVQPPTASWGNMLTDAQSLSVLTNQPWIWFPPGVLIFITVLSINFIGDGLRDAMDPKSKL